jgi:anthranilate phosphoribosyltransferase
MSISSFLKIIGRGSKGAGNLDRIQANEVFTQILNGNVSDLELGAFCIAMRIKGESVSELLGFMDALEPHLNLINPGSRPCIVLPSYNGARKQANLTPLLAGMLSSQGFTVLIQGIENDQTRVTSHEIFKWLDWPIIKNPSEFSSLLNANVPIFCPLSIISPALQKLLDIRERIGLRNTGHVLAKLINPTTQNPWQVSNYTHPEYPEKFGKYNFDEGKRGRTNLIPTKTS